MDILVNGEKQTNISVLERLVQFGDGVFETCLRKNGKILYWDLHWQRLNLGLKRLQITPINLQDLANDLAKITADNCIVKIMISRGISQRGYAFTENIKPTRIIICSEIPKLKAKYQLNFCTSGYAKNTLLAGIKHNNRLEQILARASVNTDEGIMLDANNCVISATSANIFIIKNAKIKTPKLDNCGILGTRRALIIRRYLVQITTITMDELLRADEVFLTSSVLGIKPVKRIAQQVFTSHTITNTLNLS